MKITTLLINLLIFISIFFCFLVLQHELKLNIFLKLHARKIYDNDKVSHIHIIQITRSYKYNYKVVFL